MELRRALPDSRRHIVPGRRLLLLVGSVLDAGVNRWHFQRSVLVAGPEHVAV
jgi:hypothetical protein